MEAPSDRPEAVHPPAAARPDGLPGWPWPADAAALEHLQRELGALAAHQILWRPSDPAATLVAAAFVAYATGVGGPGGPGTPAWAAAVLMRGDILLAEEVRPGETGAAYAAGLLALRCGPLLEHVLRALPAGAQVLLLDATGADHPRAAGLALHVGAVMDLPSVGVTNRALTAVFAPPGERRGDASELLADGRLAGYAVRTRAGVNPVLAHAAWRTSPETARLLVSVLARQGRTPEPLRRARMLARVARARAEGRFPP